MTNPTEDDRNAAETIRSVICQEAGLQLVLNDKDWLATVIADYRPEPSKEEYGDGVKLWVNEAIERAKQSCRYVLKETLRLDYSPDFKAGFKDACEICEGAIREHVLRHLMLSSLPTPEPTKSQEEWAQVRTVHEWCRLPACKILALIIKEHGGSLVSLFEIQNIIADFLSSLPAPTEAPKEKDND